MSNRQVDVCTWFVDTEGDRPIRTPSTRARISEESYKIRTIRLNTPNIGFDSMMFSDMKMIFEQFMGKIKVCSGRPTAQSYLFISSNGELLNGHDQRELENDASTPLKAMFSESRILRHILNMEPRDYIIVVSRKTSSIMSSSHPLYSTQDIHNVRHIRIAQRDLVRNSYTPHGSGVPVSPLLYEHGIWSTASGNTINRNTEETISARNSDSDSMVVTGTSLPQPNRGLSGRRFRPRLPVRRSRRVRRLVPRGASTGTVLPMTEPTRHPVAHANRSNRNRHSNALNRIPESNNNSLLSRFQQEADRTVFDEPVRSFQRSNQDVATPVVPVQTQNFLRDVLAPALMGTGTPRASRSVLQSPDVSEDTSLFESSDPSSVTSNRTPSAMIDEVPPVSISSDTSDSDTTSGESSEEDIKVYTHASPMDTVERTDNNQTPRGAISEPIRQSGRRSRSIVPGRQPRVNNEVVSSVVDSIVGQLNTFLPQSQNANVSSDGGRTTVHQDNPESSSALAHTASSSTDAGVSTARVRELLPRISQIIGRAISRASASATDSHSVTNLPEGAPIPAIQQSDVDRLTDMGFSAESARDALARTGGRVERAIDELL